MTSPRILRTIGLAFGLVTAGLLLACIWTSGLDTATALGATAAVTAMVGMVAFTCGLEL